MSKVYFVDLDGTVVRHGTHDLLPGAKERLDAIAASGGEIWFFSCWAFSPFDVRFLKDTFPYHAGFIRKPLGDAYVFFDDKLLVNECATSLSPSPSAPAAI